MSLNFAIDGYMLISKPNEGVVRCPTGISYTHKAGILLEYWLPGGSDGNITRFANM